MRSEKEVVSEELNSVETCDATVNGSEIKEFQKNLIVWKLYLCLRARVRARRVSEELNSVETAFRRFLLLFILSFRRT